MKKHCLLCSGCPTLLPRKKKSVVYDLSGRRTAKMQRGINIVRMSDGTVKMVMVND